MSSFAWTDLMVRIPGFGLIARNAKNLEDGSRPGWLISEEKLCGAYKPYFGTQLSRNKFMERIEYLKHAGDLGRSPMGAGLMLFLFVLVAAEAMGFSYILGTWAASEGSANLYTKLMYAIVFVLASILAIVTHKAGEQCHRTSLIRSCFKRYKEDKSNTKFHSTRVIALADDQFADAHEPAYSRCMNRIINNPHDMGSYGWCWTAGIFVLLIFIGSATMRFSHMETQLNQEAQAMEQTGGSNPFANTANAPSEMVAAQKESDQKAKKEERASTVIEGGAAIAILSVIFVVTQIVGFGAGTKHCFAGKETYKKAEGSSNFWFWAEHDGAYADTCGYSTYENYAKYLQPRKDQVNTRLKELQHLLVANSTKNIKLSNTFEMYLSAQAAQERADEEALNMTPVAKASIPVIASKPIATLTPTEKAKAAIDAMATKEESQAYFLTLPSDVQNELKPWLKARKEAAEKIQAAQISQAELSDLF